MTIAFAPPSVQPAASGDAAATSITNLDLLRGMAALSVLVWHFQHFFYPQAGVGLADRSIQPLYPALRWLYEYGGFGVQLFWLLSGFVFFHAYQHRQQTSWRSFFVNRFSRLYPLHLITLLLVAALQWFSTTTLGHAQIYPANDGKHFVLHLFMASHWGLQSGWSFNAPIWSVSVEVLVYVVFFIYLKVLGIGLRSALLWLGAMLLAFQGLPGTELQQCAALFVLGGLLHLTHARLCSAGLAKVSALTAAALLGLGLGWLAWRDKWQPAVLLYLVFPGVIWGAAALEPLGVASHRFGTWFGQLTYSSYLIHVPLQITLMTGMDLLNLNRMALVQTPAFFLSFLLLVIVLSDLTFRFVEMPLKRKVRQALLRPGA